MSQTYIAILLAGFFAAVLIAIWIKPTAATLVDQAKPKPNLADPNSWVAGPIYNNQPNPSIGMPYHPQATPDGLVFDLQPGRELHYATVNFGSLTGKTKIMMKGRIEIPEGARIVAASDGTSNASMTLYFQRIGDDWNGTDSDPYNDSDTESYRWWATPATLIPLAAGPFEISANFADLWTAEQYSTSLGAPPAGKPQAFKAAMDNAGEVGFTCGGGSGSGHGIKAPAGAKIIVEKFEIV